MTADHIGRFIPGTPFFLRIAGRASRPLFAYCAVQGFIHTSDTDRYRLRLYIFSVITGVMNFVLNGLYPQAHHRVTTNIFTSLLMAFFILEEFCPVDDIYHHGSARKVVYITVFNMIIHSIAGKFLSANAMNIVSAVFPDVFHAEGSKLFFLMVAALYAGRRSRKGTVLYFGGYCLVYLALILLSNTSVYTAAPLPLSQLLFRYSIQWLQILALPVMLLYNGKKGAGLKYLFYIYYPLHIALLFVLGNTVFA